MSYEIVKIHHLLEGMAGRMGRGRKPLTEVARTGLKPT